MILSSVLCSSVDCKIWFLLDGPLHRCSHCGKFLRAPSYSDKPNLSVDDFLVKHTRKTCFLTYVTSMAIFTSRISLAWLSFLVLFLVSSKRAQLLPTTSFRSFRLLVSSLVGLSFTSLITHKQRIFTILHFTMATRCSFENSNEVGVFAALTNAYCLTGKMNPS